MTTDELLGLAIVAGAVGLVFLVLDWLACRAKRIAARRRARDLARSIMGHPWEMRMRPTELIRFLHGQTYMVRIESGEHSRAEMYEALDALIAEVQGCKA